MRPFKRGDRVKVWSLQSFSYGGFLEGEPGLVRQDQGSGKSVLVILTRKINGEYMLDSSYEVYAQQVELVAPATLDSNSNVGWFLELNNKIKEKSFKKTKREKLAWQYSYECYLDENDIIQLNKDRLEFPEDFI